MLVEKIRVGDTLRNKNGLKYLVSHDYFICDIAQKHLRPVKLNDEELIEFGLIQPKGKQFFIHKVSELDWKLNLTPTFRFAQVNDEDEYSVSLGMNEHGFIFTRLKYLHELEQFWDINYKTK